MKLFRDKDLENSYNTLKHLYRQLESKLNIANIEILELKENKEKYKEMLPWKKD